jgi:carboxymethylenebutenolidase
MSHIDGLRGLSGYLNDGAGAGRPRLLVIHEMWGLNQQVRGVVDRLAEEGFVAFGVDLYRGKVPSSREEAEELVRTGDKAQWFADLRLAARALLPSKVGVVGFSMGGAFALATAAMVPEVSACVSFYGVPRPEIDLTKVRLRSSATTCRTMNTCLGSASQRSKPSYVAPRCPSRSTATTPGTRSSTSG